MSSGASASTSTEIAPQDDIDKLLQSYLEGISISRSGENDVSFQDLSIVGGGLGVQKAPTIPSAALDLINVLNPARYLSKRPEPSRTILHKFNGSIRGGEMLLVIGKPGSGCTTFLKAMANMREEYKSFEGQIVIGGRDAIETKQTSPGHFVFAGEDDIHFHSLSVEKTLRFALTTRTPMNVPDRRNRIENDLEALLKLMGLHNVSKTQVGNDYIRGVSGGERRRVTLAEAMVTRAGLLCFDNPTRGLDSATASRFLKVARRVTDETNCVTVMSLYQASELNAKYFDKVMVINSGREIYFGPVSEAKEYFEALGFYCPPSTTLPDFLTSMSGDPSSRSVRKDFKGQVPLSAEDFERAFKSSQRGVALKTDAKTLPQSSKPISLKGPSQKYFVPFHKQVYECTIRHFRINFTDRTTWVAEATGTLVQALMLGTLFFNQQSTTLGLYTRGSAIFFCVLIMGLQASAEFGNTFAQRPILLKHNALRFYRPSAYALGQIFADIPWKVVFVLYNLPIYWMVNLKRSAGHFFIWLFALYMTMMALGVVFRSIAVFTVTPGKAILPVGLMLNILIIYTGFYVTPPGMKVWLSWIRYLNPMYYGFESVMLNEIASSSYGCSTADIVPTGAGFSDSQFQSCALSGSSPGDLLLKGTAYIETFYDFRDSHLWRNVGINAGFFLFFSVLVAIGMEGFKVPAGQLATVFFSKEPVAGGDRSTDIEKANSDVGTEAEKYHEADASHRSIGKPQTFSWKQLSLDVDVAGEKKRILHDISGYLAPGSSTALMGLSGAGKTTLLHELSQRGSFGVLTGKMFLDDGPLPRSMRRRSGFVHQQDIHLDTSTVREALQLSAYLRQPADISKADKDAYVETVLSMLGIESIADALIGVPGSGLDLEQRKRLSIGVELAAKPDLLLFLDEPTSGLDANSAMSIIRLLRKLSNLGQTVLCTIHQPSAELMDYFDNLLLLVPGGKTAYFGPLGAHCESAIDYFARHAPRCGPEENPAEYLLDQTVNPEYDWSQIWNESDERKALLQKFDRQTTEKAAPETNDQNLNSFATGYVQQILIVTQRAFLNYWREPTYVLSKVQLNISMALMNGLTFLQLSSSLTDSRNRMFSIFVSVITGPVLSLSVEPRFIILRDQFLAREKDNRAYSWVAFVMSAILVELPFTLLGGLIYWVLWYYMVGYFGETSRAGYSFVMYELYSVFVTSLAQLIAAIFPVVGAAHVATGFVWLMVNTFNGPLSPPPLTPRGWRWFYNISPLFYYVEGMASNAMHGLKIQCTSSETTIFNIPNSTTCAQYTQDFLNSTASTGYLLNPSGVSQCEYCPYDGGDSYIAQYDFNYSNHSRNVGIFIGFILFNYTMVFCATYLIYLKKWKKSTKN